MPANLPLRTSDYVAGVFGASLQAIVAREAPQVTLRFADQGKEDVAALREGRIDLDIGVLGTVGPELRVQTLVRDDTVAVVRHGHPLLKDRMTAQRFAAATHVSASRRGFNHGPIDDALAAQGLSRQVRFVVPGFHAAMPPAAGSDIVAAIPLAIARGRGSTRLKDFPLRFAGGDAGGCHRPGLASAL